MAGREVNYDARGKVLEFMKSDAEMRVLLGPVGSGKSTACVIELVRRAGMQEPGPDGVRRTRACVVRETMKQLKDTTIKTFLDWFPEGEFGTYKKTDREFIFTLGDVHCEILFRALDDAADIANLNSLELTFAWFNECRDIRPEMVYAMKKRIGRYPSMRIGGPTWKGMWGDTNPPSVGEWWYYQMEGIDPNDGMSPLNNGWDVFKQPSGRSPDAENIDFLIDGYYDTQGLSEDFIRVYIDGEYGLSNQGKPVFPEFSLDAHVSKELISTTVYPTQTVIIGMDLGLDPAVVFSLVDPQGRVIVLDELAMFNMGVQRFVREYLKPHLFKHFAGRDIRLIVDPAGMQRAQTDERSAVDIIRAEGLSVMPARTNSIQQRIGAVSTYLTKQIDNKPAFVVNKSCMKLIHALRTGYRFSKKGGEIDKKSRSSHIGDALQYMMLHVDSRGEPFSGGAALRVVPPPEGAWLI
jgi:phage terminase large subunit